MTGPAGSLSAAVALVTGAGSGIGTATACRLAREGAAIALVAGRPDGLDRVVAEVAGVGGHAVAVQADITDPEQAEQAVMDTLERFGRLDVLVNNAEVVLLDTALHTMLEQWSRTISLNVSGMLHVTHAAVPYLIDAATTAPRQVADIVNVGSTAGRVARAGSSVYNLSKFGLTGFTESLRQELLTERVRVSVVQPGTGGTLRPEDVADAIGYVVTRDRRVAVNEMVVRAGDQLR
jgi:NADP-dependent 3-hydroxy acid dehydrogenase YdfG